MIGLIGGTGPEGRGLGMRFAMAGEDILIGSRDLSRAVAAAEKITGITTLGRVSGAVNDIVAMRADPVFVTVPYEGQRPTLEHLSETLAGKVVVEVVAPIGFEKRVAHIVAVPDGSAAEEAQALLPKSRVVAAFQTISAHDLLNPTVSIDSDILVCGNDVDAKQLIMSLSNSISGARAVDGGGLSYARYVEGFTALLLNINRIYKTQSSVRIVGI